MNLANYSGKQKAELMAMLKEVWSDNSMAML
jgi:hypothetical protein